MEPCHRLAFQVWVGPIDHDTVHHKCAVRHCFNPDHLEAATLKENVLEMHERAALRRKIRALEAQIAELQQTAANAVR